MVLIKRKKKISLVLGGGAARGIAHLGIYKYLQSKNVGINEIAGTSMGALLGAAFALEIPMDKIDSLLKKLVKKLNILEVISPSFSKLGIIDSKRIEKYLYEKVYGDKEFKDTKIPLKINATDVETGKEVVFNKGKIVDAVRASIAIPGIIPPKLLNNKILVDGGVLNNVPVDLLKEKNPKKIFVVNVRIPLERQILYRKYIESEKDFWKRSRMFFEPITFDYLEKCFDILRSSHEEAKLKNIPKNHILELPYKKLGYEDFHKGIEIEKLGKEIAEKKWGKFFD